MEQVFIQNIKINKVRHLEQIDLPVGECERKHIILTGKNGSGKTSVLNAVATFIHSVTVGKNPDQIMEDIKGAAAGVWLDFNTSFVAQLPIEIVFISCVSFSILIPNSVLIHS